MSYLQQENVWLFAYSLLCYGQMCSKCQLTWCSYLVLNKFKVLLRELTQLQHANQINTKTKERLSIESGLIDKLAVTIRMNKIFMELCKNKKIYMMNTKGTSIMLVLGFDDKIGEVCMCVCVCVRACVVVVV